MTGLKFVICERFSIFKFSFSVFKFSFGIFGQIEFLLKTPQKSPTNALMIWRYGLIGLSCALQTEKIFWPYFGSTSRKWWHLEANVPLMKSQGWVGKKKDQDLDYMQWFLFWYKQMQHRGVSLLIVIPLTTSVVLETI